MISSEKLQYMQCSVLPICCLWLLIWILEVYRDGSWNGKEEEDLFFENLQFCIESFKWRMKCFWECIFLVIRRVSRLIKDKETSNFIAHLVSKIQYFFYLKNTPILTLHPLEVQFSSFSFILYFHNFIISHYFYFFPITCIILISFISST